MGNSGELAEYSYWSDIFKGLASDASKKKSIPAKKRINLIPLAGRGSRFADRGYKDPKPLIQVDGEAMVVHAAKSLPPAEKNVFICLADHLKRYPLQETLERAFPGSDVVPLSEVTEGQAITVSLGLKQEDYDYPLLIAASDNGMLYDWSRFESLAEDPKTDMIVFTFSGHPGSARNPKMYGWVKKNGNRAAGISVKVPISENPIQDDAVVGAFYFKSAGLFMDILSEMKEKNIRVNGEFYADSMAGIAAERGLNVQVLRVDHYICWGTPDEYNTYQYWKEFFSKVSWHPYGKK
ncbi:MAG TPA: NTP transferase domain-containing protein [Leptospiraceae bacterium]|nr:NTP transferase domain-containing protein [Leptospiraceae bacterium]